MAGDTKTYILFVRKHTLTEKVIKKEEEDEIKRENASTTIKFSN